MAKPPIEIGVQPNDDSSKFRGESQFLNRLVWLTAATVFPLIWAGGLVTTTKAGMAVPDWPGTYGYNMFLYPWTTWFFGPWDLFIEHGHRLLGSLAGIWCLLLVGATWIRPTPKSVRVLALGGLALVVLQGIMGGVRVLNVDREIARIHGCLGPAFFAYLLGLSVVTSRWWKAVAIPTFWTNGSGLTGGETSEFHSQAEIVRAGRLVLARLKAQRFLTMVVLGLAYGQLVLGASMRHIAESAEPSYFRAIVWFHVTGAICTAGAAIALWVAARCPTPGLSMPRWILVGLVGLQICLGLGTWVMKYNFPDWFAGYAFAQAHRIVSDDFYQVQIVTAHVAVGSLILGVAALLLTRLWRAEFCLQSIVAKFPLEVQRETSSDRSTVQVAPGIAVGSEKLTPC